VILDSPDITSANSYLIHFAFFKMADISIARSEHLRADFVHHSVKLKESVFCNFICMNRLLGLLILPLYFA